MRSEELTADQVWTTFVVTQLARAAVGLIGPDVRALGCEVQADVVVVHVLESYLGGCNSEDISDIAFELDVLLDGKVLIETRASGTLDWGKIFPVYVGKNAAT